MDEWLRKPENDFLISFLYYIFNFSTISILTAVIFILIGLFDTGTNNYSTKKLMLFVSWFLISFLTGFLYSRYISSVLQYSVLIFAFPYLYFVMFGHIKAKNFKKNLIAVLIILTVNIYSLVFERDHYRIFYNSPYETLVTDYIENKTNNGSITSVIDSHKEITNYYLKKYKADHDFVWFDSFRNLNEFIEFLKKESLTSDKLYLGCLASNDPLTVPVIQDYFPKIISQKNYAGGTTYLFSKGIRSMNNYYEIQGFESKQNSNWTSLKASYYFDSIKYEGNYSYYIDSISEWSPAYSMNLKEMVTNKNNFIDISIKVKNLNNAGDAILVATLEANGETIHWDGTELKRFVAFEKSGHEWHTTHHSIKLSDIPRKENNLVFNTYIWNKGRGTFLIDNFTIEVREGNPIIYGLIEKF
ncbi:MAG: hypothetical protein PHH93_02535 [Prolixibacteraceae bacterium]|nr:hypothetical protein [Prolixibacteraceae bacterium]